MLSMLAAARFLHSLHKLVNDLLRNHSVLAILPTAAGPATTGTAAAKTTEAAASTETASAAETASTPPATPRRRQRSGEKHPEQKRTQRREQDDQDDDADQHDAAEREAGNVRLVARLRRSARLEPVN